MTKFNPIVGGVVGVVCFLLMAWFVYVQRDRGNMGDTDSVFIWAVVLGIVGFILGGYIGGSFEKYEGYSKYDDDEKKKCKKK